mmetsp:Transcript_44735/g.139155  ORF Transcript_44735/g.139155 Transcript_44735/m.139155 type:complete len:218 (-) Transcript_44735:680-1333(-)
MRSKNLGKRLQQFPCGSCLSLMTGTGAPRRCTVLTAVSSTSQRSAFGQRFLHHSSLEDTRLMSCSSSSSKSSWISMTPVRTTSRSSGPRSVSQRPIGRFWMSSCGRTRMVPPMSTRRSLGRSRRGGTAAGSRSQDLICKFVSDVRQTAKRSASAAEESCRPWIARDSSGIRIFVSSSRTGSKSRQVITMEKSRCRSWLQPWSSVLQEGMSRPPTERE